MPLIRLSKGRQRTRCLSVHGSRLLRRQPVPLHVSAARRGCLLDSRHVIVLSSAAAAAAASFLASARPRRGERCGRLFLLRLRVVPARRSPHPPAPLAAPAGNYPVVCLNDGQNLFGDGQGSLSGLDWQAGKTASRLIEEGKIPRAMASCIRPLHGTHPASRVPPALTSPSIGAAIVIASIDHSGSWRSFDYLPFPPGSGIGGLRKDAASWCGAPRPVPRLRRPREVVVRTARPPLSDLRSPWNQAWRGGPCIHYECTPASPAPGSLPLRMVRRAPSRAGRSPLIVFAADEGIFPRHQCSTTDPAHRVFGGSSFGGICSLWMAMLHPGSFGRAHLSRFGLPVSGSRLVPPHAMC